MPPSDHTSTSLQLQRASATSELHGSMPPRLHACSAPPALHTSIPRTPRSHVSTSARLQRSSEAQELHASTSTHLQRASRVQELHTSILPRLHAYSAPLGLHTSMRPRNYTYVETPDLYIAITPMPQVHNAPQELQHTVPTYFHVCMPAAHMQRSMPPCHYTYSDLRKSIALHRYTATRLHSTRGPFLHVSTSTRL